MDEQPIGQQVAPAGWFADQSGTMRWWDGMSWTEHVAQPTGPAPSGAQPARPNRTGARGVSTLAVVALLVGFVPYFGALALLAGITALDRIKKTGERGRIPAVVGITFGSLWALDILMLVVKAVAT